MYVTATQSGGKRNYWENAIAVSRFQLSHDLEIKSGYQNWCDQTQLNRLYKHSKFERSRLNSIREKLKEQTTQVIFLKVRQS